MKKFGHGEILPEPDDDQRTAKKNWSEQDTQELQEENERDSAPGDQKTD